MIGAIIIGSRLDRWEPKHRMEFQPGNGNSLILSCVLNSRIIFILWKGSLMTTGALILLFSWFGYLGGSTLRLSNQGGNIIGRV